MKQLQHIIVTIVWPHPHRLHTSEFSGSMMISPFLWFGARVGLRNFRVDFIKPKINVMEYVSFCVGKVGSYRSPKPASRFWITPSRKTGCTQLPKTNGPHVGRFKWKQERYNIRRSRARASRASRACHRATSGFVAIVVAFVFAIDIWRWLICFSTCNQQL